MKHVLSPNPHPVSSVEARAWDDGYAVGRRDVVEQYGGHAVASQAPAMARLLLKLQWIDVNVGEGCPSCGALRYDTNSAEVGESVDERSHAADCELVTVLRAAGVLP